MKFSQSIINIICKYQVLCDKTVFSTRKRVAVIPIDTRGIYSQIVAAFYGMSSICRLYNSCMFSIPREYYSPHITITLYYITI